MPWVCVSKHLVVKFPLHCWALQKVEVMSTVLSMPSLHNQHFSVVSLFSTSVVNFSIKWHISNLLGHARVIFLLLSVLSVYVYTVLTLLIKCCGYVFLHWCYGNMRHKARIHKLRCRVYLRYSLEYISPENFLTYGIKTTVFLVSSLDFSFSFRPWEAGQLFEGHWGLTFGYIVVIRFKLWLGYRAWVRHIHNYSSITKVLAAFYKYIYII